METEWQPVRIASIEEMKKCPKFVEDGTVWPTGKIVRVRIVKSFTHPGQVFEIHPDDDFDPKGAYVCEHQIQAD